MTRKRISYNLRPPMETHPTDRDQRRWGKHFSCGPLAQSRPQGRSSLGAESRLGARKTGLRSRVSSPWAPCATRVFGPTDAVRLRFSVALSERSRCRRLLSLKARPGVSSEDPHGRKVNGYGLRYDRAERCDRQFAEPNRSIFLCLAVMVTALRDTDESFPSTRCWRSARYEPLTQKDRERC